jgi:hypothetical protein
MEHTPGTCLHTQPWMRDTTYQGGTLHYTELDGKRIAYHSATVFLVQVGKGKGSYRPKYRVVGNLTQAVMYYIGINLGPGYKKRLLMPACSHNPLLARAVG